MRLMNKTQNIEIASEVIQANTFVKRLIGLMGRREFGTHQVLWIDRCNWIHTCFMRIPIDAIFVDRNFVVRGKVEHLKPWRLARPYWSARSVFELPAGKLQTCKVELGDQLHVGA